MVEYEHVIDVADDSGEVRSGRPFAFAQILCKIQSRRGTFIEFVELYNRTIQKVEAHGRHRCSCLGQLPEGSIFLFRYPRFPPFLLADVSPNRPSLVSTFLSLVQLFTPTNPQISIHRLALANPSVHQQPGINIHISIQSIQMFLLLCDLLFQSLEPTPRQLYQQNPSP